MPSLTYSRAILLVETIEQRVRERLDETIMAVDWIEVKDVEGKHIAEIHMKHTEKDAPRTHRVLIVSFRFSKP